MQVSSHLKNPDSMNSPKIAESKGNTLGSRSQRLSVSQKYKISASMLSAHEVSVKSRRFLTRKRIMSGKHLTTIKEFFNRKIAH